MAQHEGFRVFNLMNSAYIYVTTNFDAVVNLQERFEKNMSDDATIKYSKCHLYVWCSIAASPALLLPKPTTVHSLLPRHVIKHDNRYEK